MSEPFEITVGDLLDNSLRQRVEVAWSVNDDGDPCWAARDLAKVLAHPDDMVWLPIEVSVGDDGLVELSSPGITRFGPRGLPVVVREVRAR